ncbi:pyridoxamine 5'-phosphate oxidase family protein [Desulfobaculum sp.]
MLEHCVAVLTGHSLCVLATAGPDGPHTSLMTYVVPIPPRAMYLVTSKDSAKWRNIQQSPAVSLLVDTRLKSSDDRSRIQALTVRGTASAVDHPQERAKAAAELERVNPGLEHFLSQPDCVVFRVDIASFQLLSGVAEQFHYALEPPREAAPST